MSEKVLCVFLCLLAAIILSNAQQFHLNTRYGKRNDPVKCTKTEQENLQFPRYFHGFRFNKRHEDKTTMEPRNGQVGSKSSNRNTFQINSRYGKRDHPETWNYEDLSEYQGDPDIEDLTPILHVFQPPLAENN